MAFPNRLATLRIEARLSQEELARTVGVSKATISRWETGINKIPDARKAQLAGLFRISITHLMRWDYDRVEVA